MALCTVLRNLDARPAAAGDATHVSGAHPQHNFDEQKIHERKTLIVRHGFELILMNRFWLSYTHCIAESAAMTQLGTELFVTG